jgi:anthranilate phosphoribosyltransferase
VSSEDGLDEMSTSGTTHVVEVEGTALRTYTFDSGEAGLAAAAFEEVAGSTPEDNAAVTRAILEGQAGPRRDLALLNAGAAVYAGGRAGSIAEGVAVAAEAVDSGAAARALERYVALTHELAAGA